MTAKCQIPSQTTSKEEYNCQQVLPETKNNIEAKCNTKLTIDNSTNLKLNKNTFRLEKENFTVYILPPLLYAETYHYCFLGYQVFNFS